MGLVLKDIIRLTTLHGESEVQLLFGDITQLSPAEKVDFIFVSAFPGDYSAIPGTLIGALAKNLGLSVRDLARNKDVDLRVNFNCWVSGCLPDNMPFNRLVCFERMKRNEQLPAQISSIFRAMMPIFNDKEMTVITPLLAAGNQGHDEGLALRSIVTASCNWIKAGLPLKCLKIVVYTKNPASLFPVENDLLEMFSKLQKKWQDMKKPNQEEKKYDVCISFCEEDNTLAEQIRKGLQKFDSNIVVFSEYLVHDHGQVWQENIFDIMIHSRRVVAVLTPSYTAHSECLEQYNIALCCSRLTRRDVLTPFYMKTVDMLPSYMTLVQYTECRVRYEGESAEEKIITACSLLIKHLDADMQTEPTNKASHHDQDQINSNYDVFISYAHKNREPARHLHEALQDTDFNMKIFFDTSELRAGKIWQEALYEAVDQAKCVVAMLSSAYFNSTVCQEEYNIALSRFLSQDGIILIPVLAEEDVEEIPASFSVVPILDMRSSRRADQIIFARIIDKWLRYEKPDYRFSHPSHPLPFQNVLEAWRMKDFNNRFIFSEGDIQLKMPKPKPTDVQIRDLEQPVKRVVLNHAQDCFKHAAILSKLLASDVSMKVSCDFLSSQQTSTMPKIQAVDSADMVVTFVSDDYMASGQHRHELHTALCRQRMTKDRRVLYLIQANHTKHLPTYAHILPHSINIGDNIWMRMSKKMSDAPEKILVDLFEGRSTFSCKGHEILALATAALDIIEKLSEGSKATGSGMPTSIVNLLQIKHHAEERCVSLEQCLVRLGVISEKFGDGMKEPGPSATPDKDLANDTSSIKQSSKNKENVSPTSSATQKEKRAKKSATCAAL